MNNNKQRIIGAAWLIAALAASCAAQAQAEFTYNGVADFSYGRFEPSGLYREHRFNSNSLTASFIGGTAKYGFGNGLTLGVTAETFVRFQDGDIGRRDDDPYLSRNAFVFAATPLGQLRVGRLQTFLFETNARFNALGNSIAFSPAVRHLFAAGNLQGVQRDFYWNRSVSYTTPNVGGLTAGLMYAQGESNDRGDQAGVNLVFSRGLFAVAASAQEVQVNDGLRDPIDERAWQVGASYNFGLARVFLQYGGTDDDGLEVRSRLASAGVAVPLGPGTAVLQGGYTTAEGPAVDRRHTSISGGYLYAYDSVTDIYLLAMDDRVRGQTRGVSAAVGLRKRF